MKSKLSFLSQSEIEQIHQAALNILNVVGMQMPHKEALEMMKKAGAEIVQEDIVRISASMVDDALEKVPKRKEVVLYAREPENDINFEVDSPVLAAMTEATYVIDPATRVRRPATHEDVKKLVQLLNKLNNIKIGSPPVTPQDVDSKTSDWYTWATSIKYTQKHLTGAAQGAKCVRDVIKIASLIVGDEKLFLERPFISFWALTRPPLQIDSLTLESLIEISKWKIPVCISSGPIQGITAPVTSAGIIAMAHAEILACIVLSQIANPGTPVIYTSFARSMDMMSGSVSMSSPEFVILKGALGQMGRFLDLPVRMPAMLRDAKILDAQAGFETGFTSLISALSADIIDGMQFDMDLLVDYADLVFCNECMGAVKRVSNELKIDENTIAFDVIQNVGHGGNYLKHKHTLKNFRKEIWQPNFFERRNWTQWEKDGSQDIKEVAWKKALEIMNDISKTEEEKLPTKVQEQIDLLLEQVKEID